MTVRDEVADAPLSAARLASALIRPGGLWREVRVVAETGSTNTDLLALARAGAPEGTVLAAEAQTAGKGRLGRSWTSAPAAGLTFSVLLRPAGVPPALLGWLPLLTGVAVAAALRAGAGVGARLKWPNDVLAGGRKLAGILAESRGGAVVAGVGLNVFQQTGDLPVPTATSVALARPDAGRHVPGREELLVAILTGLAERYRAWADAGGDPERSGLRQEYLALCGTVGRRVRVTLPGGQALTGQVTGVDPLGRLTVATPSGVTGVSAGDVVHVR